MSSIINGFVRYSNSRTFESDDEVILNGIFVHVEFPENLEELSGEGVVTITSEALFYNCTPDSLNNATREQILARWPDAFDLNISKSA